MFLASDKPIVLLEDRLEFSFYEWVFHYLRVESVRRAGAQYRTQLVVGSRSRVMMVMMSGSPYSMCDCQRDRPQLILNVFLKWEQKCAKTTNTVLTQTQTSISGCHTFIAKVTVWQLGCFCPRSSTSTEWVYSGSDALRSRKWTLWGRPNFLRSMSASKCTPSADVRNNTKTFIYICVSAGYCCCSCAISYWSLVNRSLDKQYMCSRLSHPHYSKTNSDGFQ